MTEKRRAPIEVLERLAEAADGYARNGYDGSRDLDMALDAYRAATAPLRTRAEVDAEIATCARLHVRYWGTDGPDNVHAAETRWKGIQRLCSEPTTDSGSSSATAAKESRDNAAVSAGPAKEDRERCCCLPDEKCPEHGAAAWFADGQRRDADPCSCDEALELRRVIRHVHSLALEMARVTEGE